jgi:hypothetical protein
MELPNEICREIGSYLDYESRMNYNRVMDFEDRFVRKLNSDSHNLLVKVATLRSKVDKSETYCPCYKTINFQRIFHYLAETKDEVLFSIKSIRDNMEDRCDYAFRVVKDPNQSINRKQRKYIRFYAMKVMKKLEEIKIHNLRTKRIVIV